MQNMMSYMLLFFLFGFSKIILSETSSEFDRVKEHLQNSAQELPITQFSKLPKPATYINSKLPINAPHQINLTSELTSILPNWSPRTLALDPTCPYYFSKFNTPDNGRNLLSYLQAMILKETVESPFLNVLPQSYRDALPLLSIFNCRELIQPTSNPFFHNIELMIGPGQTELPLNRQSTEFSQLYCSLYGSPYFLLINQTKQTAITYDGQTLLSQDNLADVDFFLTSLPSGSCLFLPRDWVIGGQLNNSISIVFTLANIKDKPDDEFLPCTKAGQLTLDQLQFEIEDSFNMTTIGLIVYYYQILNPPVFDREYDSETFFRYFKDDKNVSQLIMKWTPKLINLIKIKLFQQLDINHDEIFNINDYFSIKTSDMPELKESTAAIFEEIHQTILAQYQELTDTIKRITRDSEMHGFDDEDKGTILTMLENLPEPVKKNLKHSNINIKDVTEKIKNAKFKPSSNKKQRNSDL